MVGCKGYARTSGNHEFESTTVRTLGFAICLGKKKNAVVFLLLSPLNCGLGVLSNRCGEAAEAQHRVPLEADHGSFFQILHSLADSTAMGTM